ncbi:MAG: hypothetical protein KDN22_20180 [Verrucomicrobiae bacterium]|nr:hypothetical protein [Verrucomicrobiae bacterium]
MREPLQNEPREGGQHPLGTAIATGLRTVWHRFRAGLVFLYAEPKLWLLEAGIAGYLAGMFLFPNIVVHTAWLLFTVAIPIWRWRTSDLNSKVYDDPGFWLLTGLLAWMLATSIFVSIPAIDLGDVLTSLVDACGVLSLYAGVSIVVRNRFQSWRRIITPFPIAGAIAMLVSVPVFYWLRADVNTFPSARLRDVLVHIENGGLHQVVTGLLCGAAAMSAACLYSNRAHWKKQLLLLSCFTVLTSSLFLTHTRGAILALLVSFAVYVFTRKDRSWVTPSIILTIVGLTYAFPSNPKVDDLTSISTSPVTHLIERGDGGRIKLYKHLYSRMDGATELVLGRGLWANDSATKEEVGWSVAFHPHSIYMATFYHGGITALMMTVGLLGFGLLRAFAVFRQTGNGTWLVLFCFGIAGQIVDGSLPFSIMTVPRIEPILLMFPMIGASAAWCEYVRDAVRRPAEANSPAPLENRTS